MLACRNLSVDYGGRRVISDVSLQVTPGQVTAVVGPSGAGKSTILRTLAFLETPVLGEIILDGTTFHYPVTSSQQPNTPWPKVTAVFQQLFLWPHLTLRRNILLPLELNGSKVCESELDDLIRRFDMEDFVDRYPNEVSGGQRQRAALVRALALKPRYLLLDEITSALDVEQAASIVAHLEDLKLTGIGILLITHYLGFLRRTADTIVFMDDGRVEESGGRDIISKPSSPGLRRFLDAFVSLEGASLVA